MTAEVAIRSEALIAEALEGLAATEVSLDNKAAFYALLHQVQLRINRVLKAHRDDIIVGIERAGLKELGPLSIKSTAVDPRYVCNEKDNWGDTGIQDALAELRADPLHREYVRHIPDHLEIDVSALGEGMRLGSHHARTLYGELNRRGWRTEEARRLSLAVRGVPAPKENKAA